MRKNAVLFSAGTYLPSHSIHASDLPGVQYDIVAMRKRLTQLGFTVQSYENANKADYLPVLEHIAHNAPNDAVHIVYFTGHGGHYSGNNYVFPSDFGAKFDVSRDMDDAALNIQKIISVFRGKGRLILILDACRADIGLSKGYYSEMTSSENVYIAYGTLFDQSSYGVDNSISWFTEAICDEILEPDIDLDAMFTKVRQNVVSKYKIQIPATVNTLTDTIVLNPQLAYDVDDEKVHDFVEKYGDEYNDRYGYFHGDDLVFIDAAQYFGIGLLDAIWKFRKVDNKKYTDRGVKLPLLPEAESKMVTFLGFRRGKRYFYCDEFHTWYYNGRQIRMGEIPPLPASMQQKMPEPGKEICVEFHAHKDGNKIIIETNLPNGCSFFVRQNTEKFASSVTVADGKIEIESATEVEKILIEGSKVFPDEKAKDYLSERCRNLVGRFVKYHPIHGNIVCCEIDV